MNPIQRADSVRVSDTLKMFKGSQKRGGVGRGCWRLYSTTTVPSAKMKDDCGLKCLPILVSQKYSYYTNQRVDHSCLLAILLELPVMQACVCTFHSVALMARKPVTPDNCHILMCSARGISASLFSAIGEEVEVTGPKGSRLASQQEGSVQLPCP